MVRYIKKKTIANDYQFINDFQPEKITESRSMPDLSAPPSPAGVNHQKFRKRFNKKVADKVAQDISRSFSSPSMINGPTLDPEFLKQLQSLKCNERKPSYGRRQSYSQDTVNKINLIYGLKPQNIRNENEEQQPPLTKFVATRKTSKTFNPKTFNRLPTILEERVGDSENDTSLF